MSKALTICVMAIGFAWSAHWSPCLGRDKSAASLLEAGFYSLYNFDFTEAQHDFATWQASHPDDPVGFVAEASGYIVGEFDRLGVLEIPFVIRDSSFQSKKKLSADPAIRAKFEDAVQHAEKKACETLAKDPRDRDALFAMTLAAGLRADYFALIDKSSIASLRSADLART
jgi:hypothetical protein